MITRRIAADNMCSISADITDVPVSFLQKLKVLFTVGIDGDVSEPLEVDALSCDTIQQVKEKILSTFKAKFGFSYNKAIWNIDIGKNKSRYHPYSGLYGSVVQSELLCGSYD